MPPPGQIGAVKNVKFQVQFGRIGVVLLPRLAWLRTEKLCTLFHSLFRNNEATHEVTIE